MHVVCFAGYSGSGKTTLIEQVIPALAAQGRCVSVIKHAHHRFDIDTPGKDTWRHRQAGAYEVLAASDQRVVLMRELSEPSEPDIHRLIAQLDARVDWVLVEGFKDCDLPKLEVLASSADVAGKPLLYPHDDHVQAIVHSPDRQGVDAGTLPVLPRDEPAEVAQWLLGHAALFIYTPPCVFDVDVAG